MHWLITFLMIPQLFCNKLKVSFGKYRKLNKNLIAAGVSFISSKTTFCCIFPPKGITKTISISFLYFSEVTSKILHGMSNGAILDVDVVSVDLNMTILKFDYYLKHDISELTVCSRVVNLALFKV